MLGWSERRSSVFLWYYEVAQKNLGSKAFTLFELGTQMCKGKI